MKLLDDLKNGLRMSSIKQKKEDLRILVRADLKNLTATEKAKESALICEKLAAYISSNCPKDCFIATFAGLSFEPDLLALHQLLPDYKLAYPRCGKERSLHFHHINNPEKELIKGYYGIREPEDLQNTLISPDEVALFIVPAFAYTAEGLRLGKGGGYYDRILSGVSDDVILLGAGFSVQLKEQLPVEEHDISVDNIILGM